MDIRFEREARTPHSESWIVEDAEHSLGRVDVHFTSSATYATLSVHSSVDDEGVQELIGAIDERIVSTADPYREDLIVTVWRGDQLGIFSDEGDEDDEDDEDEDDDEGDGGEDADR